MSQQSLFLLEKHFQDQATMRNLPWTVGISSGYVKFPSIAISTLFNAGNFIGVKMLYVTPFWKIILESSTRSDKAFIKVGVSSWPGECWTRNLFQAKDAEIQLVVTKNGDRCISWQVENVFKIETRSGSYNLASRCVTDDSRPWHLFTWLLWLSISKSAARSQVSGITLF